jgi:putative acyl-CoA dehydrogenase
MAGARGTIRRDGRLSMASGMDDFGQNQPPPYVDVDLYGTDLPLREAVTANGAGGKAEALGEFGRHWGRAEMFELARLADIHPPVLDGEVVEFDPAYHAFMAESRSTGLHASTWNADGSRAAAPSEVARAARFYMVAQVENGHMCPITMTRASVAALAAVPALLAQVAPKILSHAYDPAFQPARDKIALSIGMGMTEKQGGTDVRTNTTEAISDGEAWCINGHKWFMSAPMSDAFLVLAQTKAGLTCFYLPRFRPDDSTNGLHFERLKDKLGNRSNASSEVEFRDAYALRVGEEGRGIRTILHMVQLTRLDCAISSAGIMRAALARALHNARHRIVFQKKLIDQPVMRAVLADLALDVEGATAAVMRLCRSFDLAERDPKEARRARMLTPAIKYWICKLAPGFVYEAMECLGGNGYVEDYVLARLYREAPVNAIWEGSGNVMALDLLRAMSNVEDARALIGELLAEARGLPNVAELRDRLQMLAANANPEAQARSLAAQLALLAAAAALQHTTPQIAEAFALTRLGDNRSRLYGATPLQDITSLLLDRAHPA